jgi:hypothetical protein
VVGGANRESASLNLMIMAGRSERGRSVVDPVLFHMQARTCCNMSIDAVLDRFQLVLISLLMYGRIVEPQTAFAQQGL